MNLSQIRVALDDAGVRPAKKLGQNFLHDQNLARWIVEQAQISRDDFVLEIGPGLGALTSEILKRGARLLALEKDARLANFLREKFRDPRFELHHGDALDFDRRMLFAERNVKLIGNLPYYIASQLLCRFVDFPNCISLALFMLQNEMARRLSAKPGSADYGALTLRLQLHHYDEYLRKIPRTVFIPRPEVASAIVRFTPRDEKIAARATDERFQVVDENDRQSGTSSRLEVHENNFRHRAVHILIFNHSGEILLQKRSPWKDRHPLLWDSSAAGHVEAN